MFSRSENRSVVIQRGKIKDKVLLKKLVIAVVIVRNINPTVQKEI